MVRSRRDFFKSFRRNRPWYSPRGWIDRRDRLITHLETRWINPAYSGWVLMGLCLFFFAAASNTMAGWLYVMSGIGAALMAVAAWLVRRGLGGLTVTRVSSPPVAVGQSLLLEVIISNGDRRAKSLLQAIDPLPPGLGGSQVQPIALIAPQGHYGWRYQRVAPQRGLYRWEEVQLRTAAPLGLCWYQRRLAVKAKAIVYPSILLLNQCPLVDGLGEQQNPSLIPRALPQAAVDGLTRSLRPYRWGDPIRRVHWRTSARLGELRVRELEDVQTGQAVVLAIDSGRPWQALGLEALGLEGTASAAGSHPNSPAHPNSSAHRNSPAQRNSLAHPTSETVDSFEQAVTALASLYRYACRRYGAVQLWTASHGLIHGEQRILEALASVQPGQGLETVSRPRTACIWLTQDPDTLATLPAHSAWLLWPKELQRSLRWPQAISQQSGQMIDPTQPLQMQLQAAL